MPWFALAPPASSAATTSVCPFSAALMSGVVPLVLAEEKGGAPSKEGHESRKQREGNETGGRRLERKEKEDNRRAPASLSAKGIRPLLSQLWKKKKVQVFGAFRSNPSKSTAEKKRSS